MLSGCGQLRPQLGHLTTEDGLLSAEFHQRLPQLLCVGQADRQVSTGGQRHRLTATSACRSSSVWDTRTDRSAQVDRDTG